MKYWTDTIPYRIALLGLVSTLNSHPEEEEFQDKRTLFRCFKFRWKWCQTEGSGAETHRTGPSGQRAHRQGKNQEGHQTIVARQGINVLARSGMQGHPWHVRVTPEGGLTANRTGLQDRRARENTSRGECPKKHMDQKQCVFKKRNGEGP